MALPDPPVPVFPLPPAGPRVAEWREWQRALDPARPPGDTPFGIWRSYIENAGRFIEAWGERAFAAGWTPNDLFRAHPERPYARVDVAGLVWFIIEAEV